MATPSGDPTPIHLPGVGSRLDLTDADGRPVAVVRRRDGHVEIHASAGTHDLTEHAVRALSTLFSGRYVLPQPVSERIDDVLGGLSFDIVTVRPGTFAEGRSIEELGVRRRTGVTIVAILRGPVPIVTPDPSSRLTPGDELLVAGRSGDLDPFVGFLDRGH